MLFVSLVLAMVAAASERAPVIDLLRAGRSCHVAPFYGGREEKIVCVFKLPGLSIEVSGVNEPGATLFVTELDPARWEDVAFQPGDPCVNVDAKWAGGPQGSGALIHVRTAKPYATAAECGRVGK